MTNMEFSQEFADITRPKTWKGAGPLEQPKSLDGQEPMTTNIDVEWIVNHHHVLMILGLGWALARNNKLRI